MILTMVLIYIIVYYADYCLFRFIGWLKSVGSRVVYELDYKKPILYVIPIQSILGKLPVVPVGDTGTIPHHLRNTFSGAPGDRRPGAGDGCRMWFVNHILHPRTGGAHTIELSRYVCSDSCLSYVGMLSAC